MDNCLLAQLTLILSNLKVDGSRHLEIRLLDSMAKQFIEQWNAEILGGASDFLILKARSLAVYVAIILLF